MQDFTKGPIGRQIITFAAPIILGNIFMQLYQIVDTIIVGQILGKEALAAVGASMPVVFAIVAIMIGLGSGASVVISQYFGSGQNEKIKITSDTLHIMLIVGAVIIAVIGIPFAEDIFRLTGLPENIIPQATEYLQVYLGGIFVLFGFNSISSILRGIGDSKTPLYFLFATAIINIGLDYLFILQFEWGVAGAAWATVVAQAIAYLGAILYINKTHKILNINLFKLQFDRKIFIQCVRYGLPTGIQQSFVAFGAIALSVIVNRFGTDVIAAYAIAFRIDSLAALPAMNFAAALSSFVGQNIGAGRIDRVKKALKFTLIISSITCIVITGGIIIWGESLILLFTNDAAVIEIGQQYLVIVSAFYVVFNVMFVLGGMLRGAGATMVPMVITFIALWGVRIPIAAIFSDIFGEVGIWWSIPTGWAIGAVLSYIYYKKGNWRKRSIFYV